MFIAIPKQIIKKVKAGDFLGNATCVVSLRLEPLESLKENSVIVEIKE